MLKTFVLLATSALALFGGDVQTVIYKSAGSTAVSQYIVGIPHIAYGGTWQAKILLRNDSDAAATVTAYYFNDAGTAVAVPIGGVSADHTDVSVPAHGQVVLTTDTGGPELTAWVALQFSNTGVKGQGVFTWTQASATSEAVAPMINQNAMCILPFPSTTDPSMPFDNTGSNFSGYAVANTTASALTVTFTAYSNTGTVLKTFTKNLPAFGHTSFLLTDYSELAGQAGVLRMNGAGLIPLGFKFVNNPLRFTTWQP